MLIRGLVKRRLGLEPFQPTVDDIVRSVRTMENPYRAGADRGGDPIDPYMSRAIFDLVPQHFRTRALRKMDDVDAFRNRMEYRGAFRAYARWESQKPFPAHGPHPRTEGIDNGALTRVRLANGAAYARAMSQRLTRAIIDRAVYGGVFEIDDLL